MNEVCPSCGQFVANLDEQTGWCDECISIQLGGERCPRCDKIRSPAEYRIGSRGRRSACRRCEADRRRDWRLAHLEKSKAYDRARKRAERAAKLVPPPAPGTLPA